MLALAFALTILFEIAVQIARVTDKRRAKEKVEEWGDVSDDEASPIDSSTTPLGSAQSVGTPTPVGSASSVKLDSSTDYSDTL